MKAGLDPASLNAREPRVAEIPFTSERRRMTTVHQTTDGATIAYSKGAAEEVLAGCIRQMRTDRDVELTPSDRERIRAVEHRMAADGLRVLALARKAGAAVEEPESGMTLLGLVAMMDPPRPEARAAVLTCKTAGIRAVMITGDHPLTASTVARELGLLDGGRVVIRPRPRGDERCRSRTRCTRHRRLRPCVAGRQASRRHRLAEAGRGGGHDRRRRQRCACPEEGRRRCRHGNRGNRCEQGSGRHDAARRQLRHASSPPSKRDGSSSATSRST